MRDKNNYFPNDSDICAVISAESTLRVRLSGLKLQRENDEWCYFEIDTKKYSQLNRAQRALAERVHGKGNAFGRTMKMLRDPKGNGSDDGIKKTRVYVLNPDYVIKILEQKKQRVLRRARSSTASTIPISALTVGMLTTMAGACVGYS